LRIGPISWNFSLNKNYVVNFYLDQVFDPGFRKSSILPNLTNSMEAVLKPRPSLEASLDKIPNGFEAVKLCRRN
jgi:hypothetical protein